MLFYVDVEKWDFIARNALPQPSCDLQPPIWLKIFSTDVFRLATKGTPVDFVILAVLDSKSEGQLIKALIHFLRLKHVLVELYCAVTICSYVFDLHHWLRQIFDVILVFIECILNIVRVYSWESKTNSINLLEPRFIQLCILFGFLLFFQLLFKHSHFLFC